MTKVHARAREHPASDLDCVIPNESELTAGVVIEPGRSYGFLTDTTLCIGCKACEVACKEWNNLPAETGGLTGLSYDNTLGLSSTTWRHVAFVETTGACGVRADTMPAFQSSWLMLSDVCKHCDPAPCLEACPTGSIFRTEFDMVVVQQDICNGCGYCVPACPFGVVQVDKYDGKAHKCTLCYDRMKGGLEPACSKACPTNSIQFGVVEELQTRAEHRVEELRELGVRARGFTARRVPRAPRAGLIGSTRPSSSLTGRRFMASQLRRPGLRTASRPPSAPGWRPSQAWRSRRWRCSTDGGPDPCPMTSSVPRGLRR